MKHGVSKIVILDIDLHHGANIFSTIFGNYRLKYLFSEGNGTQSIVWQINEESYRKQTEIELEGEGEGENKDAPLKTKDIVQIYYGSLHDPSSYPCEDGNTSMIQAASVSIHGPHGQHIENVHMSTYASEEDFWNRLYAGSYNRLLTKAEEFLRKNSGESDSQALIFIRFVPLFNLLFLNRL